MLSEFLHCRSASCIVEAQRFTPTHVPQMVACPQTPVYSASMLCQIQKVSGYNLQPELPNMLKLSVWQDMSSHIATIQIHNVHRLVCFLQTCFLQSDKKVHLGCCYLKHWQGQSDLAQSNNLVMNKLFIHHCHCHQKQ